MSNARLEYINRIQSIIFCLESQDKYNDYISDLAPIPINSNHNLQAQLLRNGLAISIFCYLEDFIKARINECINQLPSAYNQFSLIPKALKIRLTHLTLEGITKRSLTIKNNGTEADLINFIQSETKHISSTINAPFSTSNFAFGWAKENLNTVDIANIFKEFFIKDFWRKVNYLSSIINLTLINSEDDFKNIMKNRHKAAHVANTQIPSNTLFDLAKSSFIIAFCIDYLISKSIHLIFTKNTYHLDSNYDFNFSVLKFRNIKHSNNQWKEYSKSNKCIKIHDDFNTLFNLSSGRLKNNDFLICYSKNGFIKAWDIK